MLEYIEKMKTKPEHIRKRFAFLTAFAVSFIIFAGWIASYGFSNSPVVADTAQDTHVNKNVGSPFSSLTASVVSAYNDVKNIIFGSNEVKYSADTIEVTGGGK